MNPEKTEKGWYSILMDTFHSIMKKYDMPEDIANDIEAFVMSVAREQFRAGSKSGAAFIYKKYGIRRDAPATIGVA